MLMIPELLQVQRYVLTYRFSQDHLELLFNSIRASGRIGVLLITINSENIPNDVFFYYYYYYKVLRAAERVIRQASTIQASKVSTVTHIVREEIGTEDI